MNEAADWMRLAIRNWLSGNGELSALGLTADDRQATAASKRLSFDFQRHDPPPAVPDV